jgi:L-malate glycosyltransferase
MKILVFTSSASSFNSLRPEAEMFIGFARKGHFVTMATQSDSDYGRRYAKEGIRVIDCQPRQKICIRSIRRIRSELRTERYDILYLTNSKTIPNGAFAALGLGVKVVSYRGTTGGLYRHDPSAYLTHLHPRIDGIVCVSEAVRQDVLRRVWKNRKNVVAIHKGHNVDWYTKQPADLGEFGIKPHEFTVICAVNARPSKGIVVMLQAADLLADIQDLHLLLVGRNMEQYRPLIERNRMAGRIHLAGYRLDAPELIAASSVLVQPSISGEGLPRAVMEAMGYGTPAIVTDTGGGKEVVDDGRTGFIVPTGNPSAIAGRVRDLLHNPVLARSMSVRGREKIARELSCDRSTELYIRYFESLLAGRPDSEDTL